MRCFDGPANQGDAPGACVDVGLHRRRDRARRSAARPDHPRRAHAGVPRPAGRPALKSKDVLDWLQRAIEEHGAPRYLRSDNGPEFIAKAVQQWLKDNVVKTLYIEPASPWQNGFEESFHGRFRDERRH